jgi:hypothetical protein
VSSCSAATRRALGSSDTRCPRGDDLDNRRHPPHKPGTEELGLHNRVCVPLLWRGTHLGVLMVIDLDGTLSTGELGTISDAANDLARSMIGEHPPQVDEVTSSSRMHPTSL